MKNIKNFDIFLKYDEKIQNIRHIKKLFKKKVAISGILRLAKGKNKSIICTR